MNPDKPLIVVKIAVEKGGNAKEIVFTRVTDTPGVDLKHLLDMIQNDFLALYRAINPNNDERNN